MSKAHLDFDDLQQLEAAKFDGNLAYCNTKLMNVCFSRELDRRLKAEGSDVRAVSLHPGWIPDSSLYRGNACMACCQRCCFTFCCKCCGKQQSLQDGGNVEAYAATSDAIKGGEYLHWNTKVVDASVEARDDAVCKRLWEWSETVLKLEPAGEGAGPRA
mmetsp:Transcript_118042/g.328161  ORF Transcript_118042/g.328161 Transcript_118042/m.328161 type:complete len:159 (-) Transcript_118042:25-501(-)